jgi:hypothetical protein
MKLSYALLTMMTIAMVGCPKEEVDSSKRLSELSTDEAKDVCFDLVDEFPERMVSCGDGVMITIGGSADDCDGQVPDGSCTATVGDARDCAEAQKALTDAQLCADGPLPDECVELVGCST